MARNRPTLVFVMAILHIVFGTLGFFAACCSGGGAMLLQFAPIPAPWNPRESLYKPMIDVLDAEAPNHLSIQLSICATEMFLLGLLIAGGIGLIGMRGWARVLVVIASILGMIVLTGSFIWAIVIFNPAGQHAQAALMESMRKNMAAQNTPMPSMDFNVNPSVQVAIQAAVSGVVMLYCVIALVTMLLPSVSEAFASSRTSESEAQDYRDP
jgi:hypothetical protein